MQRTNGIPSRGGASSLGPWRYIGTMSAIVCMLAMSVPAEGSVAPLGSGAPGLVAGGRRRAASPALRPGLRRVMRLKGGGISKEAFEGTADGQCVENDLFGMDSLLLNHLPPDVRISVKQSDMDDIAGTRATMSEQVRMTQMFLVLQNERIESMMPGGHNCTYADSWHTGALWDDPTNEFKWTRSAWIQAQRAKSWQDMPPVWKRIMVDSWNNLQDFMAMLALPDDGPNTAKFQAFEEVWEVLRASYTSNVNQALGALEGDEKGVKGLAEEVAEKQAEVQKVVDMRMSEQKTEDVVAWSLGTIERLTRKAAGLETQAEKLEQHRSTEVQLFGIGIFNTKDPLSDRLWNMAASQGDTITAWPLKFLAWVARKWERDDLAPLPPDVPTYSPSHVLLNNTRYHGRYSSGEVDKRRANALETLHDYIASKLNPGYDTDRWNRLREPWEGAAAGGDGKAEEQFTEQVIRSPEDFHKQMFDRIFKRVLSPLLEAKRQERGEDGGQGGEEGEKGQGGEGGDNDGEVDEEGYDLAGDIEARVNSMDIADPREEIIKVFKYGGGGELRMVARALGLKIPPTMREWMDDPMADEGVMRTLLAHPSIQGVIEREKIPAMPEITHLDEGDQ